MLKFWSEVRSARLREMIADIATWAWVALWAVVGWRIYSAIAGYSEAGRILASGGTYALVLSAELHAGVDVERTPLKSAFPNASAELISALFTVQ